MVSPGVSPVTDSLEKAPLPSSSLQPRAISEPQTPLWSESPVSTIGEPVSLRVSTVRFPVAGTTALYQISPPKLNAAQVGSGSPSDLVAPAFVVTIAYSSKFEPTCKT